MVAIGALLAGLAVVLGAFAAHALADRLEPARLDAFRTGVHYQMIHALAVLLVAALARLELVAPGAARTASICFLLGTLLFSGSIYGLSLGGPRWLGPVTPLGGTFFIVGWAVLAWASLSRPG